MPGVGVNKAELRLPDFLLSDMTNASLRSGNESHFENLHRGTGECFLRHSDVFYICRALSWGLEIRAF